MTKKELKELINQVIIQENVKNDFPMDMVRALKQAKKKGDHEQVAYYTQALDRTGPAYAGWDNFKGSWAYEQWLKKPETQKLIKSIKDYYDSTSYMRENVTENVSTDPSEALGDILDIVEDPKMDDFDKVINIRARAKRYFDTVGYKVATENYSDTTSYKTQKGYDAAKKRVQSLKDELKKIQGLKNREDYLDNNDPQARLFHNRRLKEIPKEISTIRQKILGLNN
jgi:hypothetical protein